MKRRNNYIPNPFFLMSEDTAKEKCLEIDTTLFNGKMGWGEYLISFNKEKGFIELHRWIHFECSRKIMDTETLLKFLVSNFLITSWKHYLEFLTTFKNKYQL